MRVFTHYLSWIIEFMGWFTCYLSWIIEFMGGFTHYLWWTLHHLPILYMHV
jgi:hypothetical protein